MTTIPSWIIIFLTLPFFTPLNANSFISTLSKGTSFSRNHIILSSPSPEEIMENDRNEKMALIILNMPIQASGSSKSLFERLWQCAIFRVCADGGANRLYDATSSTHASSFVPNLICGDLDSIQPNILQYYQQLGCKVERNPDQDCNDLEKSLSAVAAAQDSSMHKCNVCVYGAFDGRFDQTMASIQSLYKFQNQFDSITLYNEHTTAKLLQGDGILNTIRIRSKEEGPACGLLPIGSKCDWVYTSGLVWNLNGEAMEFGGLVSTSNQLSIQEDEEEDVVVTVRSSHPLIWTTELHHWKNNNN